MRATLACLAAPILVGTATLAAAAIWTLAVDRSVANAPILLWALVITALALLGGLLFGLPLLALVSRFAKPGLPHALAIGIVAALATQVLLGVLLKPGNAHIDDFTTGHIVGSPDLLIAGVLGALYGAVFWWLALRRRA